MKPSPFAIIACIALCLFAQVRAQTLLEAGAAGDAKPIPPVVPTHLKPALGRSAIQPEIMGQFPIALSRLQGIDEVIILNANWIIAITTNAEAVAAEIETLSGNTFFDAIARWEVSEATEDPDYTLWHGWQEIRDKHMIAARKAAGEEVYEDPSFFALRSEGDSNYSEGANPTEVYRHYVSLDKNKVPGSVPFHYAHYCYLHLPTPLTSGNTYRIQLGNGKTADFLYDENHSISRAIKVNQVGYLPDAQDKFAYLGAHVFGKGPLEIDARGFEVINASTGEVALAGPITLRDRNSRFDASPDNPAANNDARPLMHGENVYQMDLSALKDEGHFFIRVPGVGRSWPFPHRVDAYGEAFYTSARGLFHQRAAMAYEKPYTAWKRGNYHGGKVYESEWVPFGPGYTAPEGTDDDLRFDVIAATIDRTKATENVDGGWYDAADWDRNYMHYACIFDLLYAYEIAPKKFSDGQLNIPESGNGVPDIIDEAAYGLKVWTHSMDERGGVSGYIETTTHPMIDGPYDYAFSLRTRWSSLLYAGAAAQLAELLAPFDAGQSEELTALARRAYAFGNDPSNSLKKYTLRALDERGAGAPYTVGWEETDQALTPFLVHAKTRLYLLTGEKEFLVDLDDLLGQEMTMPGEWPFAVNDFSAWLLFPIAYHGKRIPTTVPSQYFERYYVQKAQDFVSLVEDMPYRHSWPRHLSVWMNWGASDMTNRGRFLLIGHALTDFKPFREAAVLNLDYMFGANPMGMSWTTGIGTQYPAVIQHEVSEHDEIEDPVPGITIYGITGDPVHYRFRHEVYASPTGYQSETRHPFYEPGDLPLYRSYTAHPMINPNQCEFTIEETISSTAFACALLMPDGWMPSEELKTRLPRDQRHLFGYYYLP